MKIKCLNNATTFIDSGTDKIVLDPWVVGNLYHNSWSAFPYYENYKKYFKSISHILISHFHADHFDPETLKLIDRKAKVFVPNLKFNSIMGKTLNSLGFEDIKFLDLCCWHKISKNFSLYIIPPLNEMAQEFEQLVDSDGYNNIAIDTGFIINDHYTETNHIFLADNSPYDLNAFKKHIGDLKYSSFWFPYNGFAGDYPISYDNISIQEKRKISLEMSKIREQFNINAIEACNPEILFPYSSDFTLHGKYENDFFKVHDEQFYYKYKYAERIEKITKTKSLSLYGDDYIIFKKNGKVDINLVSDKKQKKTKIDKKIELVFPKVDTAQSFIKELNFSLIRMFERLIKYNLNSKKLNHWNVNIKTENNLYTLDLENKKVYTKDDAQLKNTNKKILLLKTNENIVRGLMQKKIHFDNAQIGCYLSWERNPNEFEKSLYDSLCFFHM